MTKTKTNTYLDEAQLPYLFCPGCGHGKILDSLNEALVKLVIDPRKLVIVTDIGCVGLSDRYFNINAFHGLHGRSVTYATGIKVANPDLKVIVLIGDGGCGIGGHHLLNAARRNIGVTTIVFNNLNYGMTGGEHSVTTPLGSITSTTPYGQLEQPLDICSTVGTNGASFVARTTTFDKNLPDLIVKAVQNDGYSLIDIWELCTAYYVPNNKFSKKALESTLDELGFQTGILQNKPRKEYSKAYRGVNTNRFGQTPLAGNVISPKYPCSLENEVKLILAGAAGTKIGSAASLFCHGALLSGLWVSQRDDYPVTVKSGHSIAEIILSPEEINYSGISKPDIMVVLFPEGLNKSREKIALLLEQDTLMISKDLCDVETKARIFPIDFQGIKREKRAVMALAIILKEFNIFSPMALKEAIKSSPRFACENLDAFNTGFTYKH